MLTRYLSGVMNMTEEDTGEYVTTTDVIYCGNCGCVFNPDSKAEDLYIYWDGGSPGIDCPNCDAYNNVSGKYTVGRCDKCGRLVENGVYSRCTHKDKEVEWDICPICHGVVDERYGPHVFVDGKMVHEYCTHKKEKVPWE